MGLSFHSFLQALFVLADHFLSCNHPKAAYDGPMRKHQKSTSYFFLALIIALGLAGCISVKQVEAFKQMHAGKQVFTYEYPRKGIGAFDLSFFLIDQEDSDFRAAIESGGNLDLNGLLEPAVEISISRPVFLRKGQAKRLQLRLRPDDVKLSSGLVPGLTQELTLDQSEQSVRLPVQIEKVGEESIRLSFRLVDEKGREVPAQGLEITREFFLQQPVCPSKETFTITLLDEEFSEPVIGATVIHPTLGGFVTDANGSFSVDICRDQLPLTSQFQVLRSGFMSEELLLEFEAENLAMEIKLPANNMQVGVTDEDEDQVADEVDNCRGVANPDQRDTDQDGVGDACDNCPEKYNPDQIDADGNGIGDRCENTKGTGDKDPPRNPDSETGGPKEDPDKVLESAYWAAIENSNAPGDFEDYLENYPNGQYADMAERKLQDAYSRVAKGLMSYIVPDTMILNEDKEVLLTISSDTSVASQPRVIDEYREITNQPNLEAPKVREEIIKITNIMSAELSDPSPGSANFFISPTGAQEQLVDLKSGDLTSWLWTVTPLQEGNHPLNVTVSLIFDKNGQKIPKIEKQVFRVNVVVTKTFWQKNWWWLTLLSAALMGVILWLLFRRKKRTKEALQLSLPFTEITDRIGKGELEAALELLENSLEGKSEQFHRQAVLLKARLAKVEEKSDLGIADEKDLTVERNQLINAVLNLLERLKRK